MNTQSHFFKQLTCALLALGAVSFATACSDDDSMTDGEGGASGDPARIEWGSCPEGFQSECAHVSLPLDWDAPEGERIPVFISRDPAKTQPAKAQLWLLQGGPGGSGDVFGFFIDQLKNARPDFDIYVLEHRGVGESTRLGCPTQEDASSEGSISITLKEWPACLADVEKTWGSKLAHFTTTADAKDLEHLIGATRAPGQKAFVYGASYGTTRALRFLQVAPSGADGVILDSIVSPGVSFLSRFDEQYDPVARAIADLCAADATCSAKMGADPWATITATIDKVKSGQHCSALGLTTEALRSILPLLVQLGVLRPHLFPLLYRMERCEDADIKVLLHYFGTLNALLADAQPTENRSSQVTLLHVTLSELLEQPEPTAAELIARCDKTYFCPGISHQLATVLDVWPRYERDMFAEQWPATDVPILAMNGTLDPQTPIENAQAIKDHLEGPSQTFVSVEYSPHGVAFESPVKTEGAPPCGTQMILGFLADPSKPIDTACLGDLKPVSFTEDPALVEKLFGVPDMWENTAAKKASKQGPIDWTSLTQKLRRSPL